MLSHNDVVDILTAITAGDRRTVGKADVTFWSAALADGRVTSKGDAIAAVVHHFATSDAWIKPVHVIEGVRRLNGATHAVIPDRIEFWRDRPFRLHDRLAFVRSDDGWHRTRLQP